jgi:hypothetical protein
MEMAQSDGKDPSPRNLGFDWLDTSSAWAQDEYGALPATTEPYDLTLKDGPIRTTQVIPISSPGASAKLGWLKQKADVSEPSITIPLEKGATGKLFGRGLTRSLMRFTRPFAPDPLVESDRTDAPRKSSGVAFLLLMLSVLALFIFAYIAQK